MNLRKDSGNSPSTTKWPRFVTNLKLSRIALLVALLATAKLAVLLSLEMAPPEQPRARQTSVAVQAVRTVLSDLPAQAQQGQAPAQPKAQPPAAQAQAQPAAKTQDANESVPSLGALKKRAEDLDRREQNLRNLQAELDNRLAQLKQLEGQLKGMLDQAQSLKDEKMRHLIDVYINMKPKQAASVLETLDEDIAVKILAGMKGRQAGEILTGVSAKKAAKLTEALTKLQTGQDLPKAP